MASGEHAHCECGRTYDTDRGDNRNWNYCPHCGRSLTWNAWRRISATVKPINLSKKNTRRSEPQMKPGLKAPARSE